MLTKRSLCVGNNGSRWKNIQKIKLFFLFIVQLVAYLTADPKVASLNPSSTLMEIDHEIVSTVIYLSITSENVCTKYRLTP